METNPVPKTNRNIMKYLSLGVAGLAMIGGSYLLFKRVQRQRQKDRILKIFTEIRKELYPIYYRLTLMHNSMLESIAVGKFLPQYIADELLVSEQPKIEAVKTRVAAKYGMKLSEFNQLVATVYKDDKDVKQKQDLISGDLGDAVQGRLDTKTTIPAFLTPQKLIEIMKKLYDESLSVTRQAIQEAAQEGQEVSYTNPVLLKKIGDADSNGPKAEILKKEGLADLEDHPEKIMLHAKEVYERDDKDFRISLRELENQFVVDMGKLWQPLAREE